MNRPVRHIKHKVKWINSALILESFIATILIFIIFSLLKLFPLKFEFVKPIRQELNDFDVYDLVYSGIDQKNLKRDQNIVLVQVGNDRPTILKQITTIKKYQPKVLGVDVIFQSPSSEPIIDSSLSAELNDPFIITGSRLDIDTPHHSIAIKGNYFDSPQRKNHSGYFNFLGDQNSVIRTYYPFMDVEAKNVSAFTSAIARQFDTVAYSLLVKKSQAPQIIQYSGNIGNYTVLNAQDLQGIDSIQLSELFYHKIVLLGVIYTEEPKVMEDLHFTPVNEKLQGKSYPDMYGMVIHANILSMILANQYPMQLSNLISLLIAFLISWIVIYSQIKVYGKNKHPSHLIMILFQFFFIIAFVYLALLLFRYGHIKIQLLSILLCVILSVELLGIYKPLAFWMNRKFNYKTVFHK